MGAEAQSRALQTPLLSSLSCYHHEGESPQTKISGKLRLKKKRFTIAHSPPAPTNLKTPTLSTENVFDVAVICITSAHRLKEVQVPSKGCAGPSLLLGMSRVLSPCVVQSPLPPFLLVPQLLPWVLKSTLLLRSASRQPFSSSPSSQHPQVRKPVHSSPLSSSSL